MKITTKQRKDRSKSGEKRKKKLKHEMTELRRKIARIANKLD